MESLGWTGNTTRKDTPSAVGSGLFSWFLGVCDVTPRVMRRVTNGGPLLARVALLLSLPLLVGCGDTTTLPTEASLWLAVVVAFLAAGVVSALIVAVFALLLAGFGLLVAGVVAFVGSRRLTGADHGLAQVGAQLERLETMLAEADALHTARDRRSAEQQAAWDALKAQIAEFEGRIADLRSDGVPRGEFDVLRRERREDLAQVRGSIEDLRRDMGAMQADLSRLLTMMEGPR